MGVFPAAVHLFPSGVLGCHNGTCVGGGVELGSFRRENLVGGISYQMQRRGIQRREIQQGMRWSARAGGAPAP